MTKPLDYDIAIVGGGVAGLAAGIGFARRGLRTIVFEKKSWPLDKPCGEGLMPDGVQELIRLGVVERLGPNDSHPFLGIELISKRGKRTRATFADGAGLGVRRTALSQAMFEVAAKEPTLTLVGNTKVLRVEPFVDCVLVRTAGEVVRAQLLIGADGLRSAVRSHVGRPRASRLRRYGANQHFRVVPWSSHVEVHLSDGMEAYVTPCGLEQVGVAFLWHYDQYVPQVGRDSLIWECLERFPDLQQRLAHCEPLGPLQTTGPMFRGVASTSQGRVIVIGDAAGYYDAITGEGMSLALKEGRLLSEIQWPHLSSDAFVYAQRRLKRSSDRVTRLSLAVARRPWLQDAIFSVLGGESSAFRFFLSLK